MERVRKEIIDYIEKNIFPSYKKNDKGHNIDHIKYVIERSFKFADMVKDEEINYDMVYVIASYHDIAHYIDAKHHEELGAKMLSEDENLKQFFTDEQIKTMSDAVYDHRSSLEGEPRTIYGKIVSSADRNTLLEVPLRRTYEYRIVHSPESSLEEIIEESRQHLIEKFGKDGYAKEKMFFEDEDYKKFLEEIAELTSDKEKFKKRYFEVNRLNNPFKLTFDEVKRHNPNMSLDEVLYAVYDILKDDYKKTFDEIRKEIIEANNIDEIEYYTKDVNPKLKEYIKERIFPEYDKNDKGHGIVHIKEVIRRSFALNDTFKLGLDHNMMYAIASCHDWGKYEDHKTHHLIAAQHFIKDENMKQFFTDEERTIIKEAIEDHRSSKEDDPRTTYGKLISSADRNTNIDIVFIRSFFVAHERTPEMNIEEYLDYTIDRLSKRYSEENPENMFYEDETYKVFLKEMRELLKKPEEFKDRYCRINNITDRNHTVEQEEGYKEEKTKKLVKVL